MHLLEDDLTSKTIFELFTKTYVKNLTNPVNLLVQLLDCKTLPLIIYILFNAFVKLNIYDFIFLFFFENRPMI